MAKLDTLPGIEVKIASNGDPLPEHEDIEGPNSKHADPIVAEYQNSRTVSVWIESETGAEFSIMLSVGNPIVDATKTKNKMSYIKLKFYSEVDGQHAWVSECPRRWFNDRPGQKRRTSWKDEVLGPKQGKGRGCKLRKFKFAKIETNSDDTPIKSIQRAADRFKKVGMIEVKVYNETAGKEGGDTDARFAGFMKNEVVDVHEKALKGDAKSHGTALSVAEKIARGPVSRTEKKDGEDYPLAIFRFYYRSQDALKQMHIIPRTPSPSPSRSSSREPSLERQGDTYGLPGLEKLIANAVKEVLANPQKAAALGIKLDGNRLKEIKKIKREKCESRGRAPKRAKGPKGKPVEIDLTGEDSEEDDEEDDEHLLFVSPQNRG
ncbi:hypothetical protein N431DRAFT_547659 [Stipitochalara longipes BDJ]|nr:hypothetical protein N431DRAFT_547659 [Stipitochalara longipes BDJ]